MAVVKRKKSKKNEPESAAVALDQIQTRGDQLAQWISENPTLILGTAAALLVATAVYGLVNTTSSKAMGEASSALAEAQADYRRAMGALPGAIEIPEPANPEIAKSARNEFIERFREIAGQYAGTLTETLALIEVGTLQAELDDLDAAISTWNAALTGVDPNNALQAIIQERIAVGQEQLGDFAAAAASHELAAANLAYPLRYVALINAARCHAEAGNRDSALAAYSRVTTESPDLRIPDHTEAMLMELQAAHSL